MTTPDSYLLARQRGRSLRGVGLGVRWEFLEDLASSPRVPLAFVEFTPENYLQAGGRARTALRQLSQRTACVSHGTSLSLGSADTVDADSLQGLKRLLSETGALWHSDHLSFSSSLGSPLHELLAVPCSRANADRIAHKLLQVQHILQLPLCVEPITWYCQWGDGDLSEAEFISRVLTESGCGLLLDINNVYINSVNHGFEPERFIDQLPLHQTVEMHVAGHEPRPDGLLIDTHGAPVCPEVKRLLRYALQRTGPVPVLLERDTNIPSLQTLLDEVATLAPLVETRCDNRPPPRDLVVAR